MVEHTITTPLIEVAEDGQNTKGVWISPGRETFPIGGKMRPHWSWGRYAVDFCKDGDEWKIWHLHVLTTFRTPYVLDWADSTVNRPDHLPKEGETMETFGKADRGVFLISHIILPLLQSISLCLRIRMRRRKIPLAERITMNIRLRDLRTLANE